MSLVVARGCADASGFTSPMASARRHTSTARRRIAGGTAGSRMECLWTSTITQFYSVGGRVVNSLGAGAFELIVLVGKEHVEARQRSVTAADVGLELQLDVCGRVHGVHLLLERPQAVANHDDLVEEGLNRPTLLLRGVAGLEHQRAAAPS